MKCINCNNELPEFKRKRALVYCTKCNMPHKMFDIPSNGVDKTVEKLLVATGITFALGVIALVASLESLSPLTFIAFIAFFAMALYRINRNSGQARRNKEILANATVQMNKQKEEAAKRKAEEENKRLAEERVRKIEERRQEVANNPAEQERLNTMCQTIHKEYLALLGKFKTLDADIDTEDMAEILHECYRKMDVIRATNHNARCNGGIDYDEESKKIERMAKKLIKGYAQNEDDVDEFYDDLWFIDDYLERLKNKFEKEDLY